MTTSKTLWRRQLIVLFCVILIFGTLMVPAAYADDATVSTEYLYSYFQTYSSSGNWVDVGTPGHTVTTTGQVAYCLQTLKDSPNNSSYHTVDGSDYYSDEVLRGLQAILENGYPVTNGGFADDQARYATANAIRFWLAENHCDGVPQYLNLYVNGNWIRGKYGYEDLYDWCLGLVQKARNQTVTTHSLSFSPASLTLEQDGDYFVGSTTVSLVNLNGGYTLDSSSLPSGSSVTGANGSNGDRITVSIPSDYEEQTYTLTASGSDNRSVANLFFYAPDRANQQRVVSYIVDAYSTAASGSFSVTTPKAIPKNGNIELSKVDENGNPVQGISFALYDSTKQEIRNGITDANGKIFFADLPLGDYFYAETATLPHLVLDPALYPVSITVGGETVTKSAVNLFARGSVSVLKIDEETGEPIAGVHFQLRDSSGNLVAEGDTQGDGKLLFTDLLLGSYSVQETATLVNRVLDSTPIPVEVTENGGTYEITHTNRLIKGSLELIKKDKFEEIFLSGAGFRLYDSNGNQVAEGYTDTFGKLSFHDLVYGDYTYQEFKAPMGFKLDETVYPLEIREDGVTVTHTCDNERRPGTIEVKKQDVNGNPFTGVAFLLEYSTDKGSTWQPVFPRDPDEADITRGGCTSPGLADGQLVTDESGKVRFSGLRADGKILYRLTETAAPEGYALMAGSLYVGTLPIETGNIYASDAEVFGAKAFVYTLLITATNDPVFRMPETGGSGLGYLPLAILLCAAPIPIITKKSKRKGEIA